MSSTTRALDQDIWRPKYNPWQAATLAYVDRFMVLAVGASVMLLLSFILKKNQPGGGADLAAG